MGLQAGRPAKSPVRKAEGMARSKLVRKKAGGAAPRHAPQMQELPSDDEVTKFHKSRDKLSLRVSDDEEDSDGVDKGEEEEDEAVFHLSDDGGSGDDDDEDASDEDDGGRVSQRAACYSWFNRISFMDSTLAVWGFGLQTCCWHCCSRLGRPF